MYKSRIELHIIKYIYCR